MLWRESGQIRQGGGHAASMARRRIAFITHQSDFAGQLLREGFQQIGLGFQIVVKAREKRVIVLILMELITDRLR